MFNLEIRLRVSVTKKPPPWRKPAQLSPGRSLLIDIAAGTVLAVLLNQLSPQEIAPLAAEVLKHVLLMG